MAPANEPPFISATDVRCPMCNAKPGAPCWNMRTANPVPIAKPHKERVAALQECESG